MRRSHQPWRALIYIVLVMGLGVTLWSGLYLISSEQDRWKDMLQIRAEHEQKQIQSKLSDIVARMSGLHQLIDASANIPDHEFQSASHVLFSHQSDRVKEVFYIPGKPGTATPDQVLDYIAPGWNSMLQAALQQLRENESYRTGEEDVLLQITNVLEGQDVLLWGRKVKNSEGYLFVAFTPKDIFKLPPKFGKQGLFIQVKTDDEVILYQSAISSLAAAPKFRLVTEERIMGAKWVSSWAFNGNAQGGANNFPGIMVMVAGAIVTLMFGWVIWMQQRIANLVQQQVVERTNQLEQASRRFRLITDNAYDLIAIATPEGTLEYVNSAYQRVLGYSREELRTNNMESLVHERDVTVLQDALMSVAKGRNAIELSFRMKHKTGRWLHMEAVAKGLHDTDWSIKNIVIHCRDVSSRKQFADDLARSEQRFRDFADSSADWLWEVNEELNFTYVSPGITRVMGYEPQEMIGNLQFEMLFDKESDPTRDLIETRVQRHQPYRDIEFWTRSKDGERMCLRISGVPVLNEEQHFSGYRGVATNITASKIDRDNMYRLATTDHLTGLLNRRRFMEELDRSVSLAKRHKTQGVLMFIDLDRFKEINDTHGHEAGDDILRGVTNILKRSFRSTDIIARLGGDEFAIIMHNLDVNGAREKVQEVIDEINAFEVDYNGARLSVTMSIGMVVYPQEDKDSDSLMMAADLAMYRAKDMGRNRMYVDAEGGGGEEAIDSVRAQLKWVNRLRTCLETGDFEMHFQPIVSAKKRARPLFEALLRIYDEEGNVGSPAIYIDAAEHFGLIQQLDLCVVDRCFQMQHDLHEQGIDVDFSINLSSRSLGDTEVMQALRDLLQKYDLDPNRILLEVTETMAIHDPSAFRDLGEIHAFISELRRLGFRFAIDDFGTGFSSFNYIRQLPVDVVKIDGSFVKDLETSKEDRMFIESMVMLCKGLGIQTIAEFVENEKIVKILDDIGVDYAQGWHLGRPLPNIAENTALYSGKTTLDFEVAEPKLLAPKAAPKKKTTTKTTKVAKTTKKPAPKKKAPAKKKATTKKTATKKATKA